MNDILDTLFHIYVMLAQSWPNIVNTQNTQILYDVEMVGLRGTFPFKHPRVGSMQQACYFLKTFLLNQRELANDKTLLKT